MLDDIHVTLMLAFVQQMQHVPRETWYDAELFWVTVELILHLQKFAKFAAPLHN